MDFKTASKIVATTPVSTPEIQEQPVPVEALGRNSSESKVMKAIDNKARGYLKTFQRSFSSSALERKAPIEDPSAMTIEFLRARLQIERADNRTEKQRAQQLVKKILELEHKLSTEIQLRKKAEYRSTEFSQRHEHSFARPDDVLSYNGTADESDRNSDEDRKGHLSFVRSTSSSAGDEDCYSDGVFDDCVDERNFSGVGAHCGLSPRQHGNHWQCVKCSGKQNKFQCQSSKFAVPEHPPDKEPCNSRLLGQSIREKPRLQQLSSPSRQRQCQVSDHAVCHELHPEEQNLNNITDATKLLGNSVHEAQHRAQEEAKKALPTKLVEDYVSASLQNQDTNEDIEKHSESLVPENGDHESTSFEGAHFSCPHCIGKSTLVEVSPQEKGKISKICVCDFHSRDNDAGVKIMANISHRVNNCRFHCGTPKGTLQFAAGQFVRGDFTTREVQSGKEDHDSGITTGEAIEGSEIDANMTGTTLQLDTRGIREGPSAYSEVSSIQCRDKIKGWPIGSPGRGDVVDNNPDGGLSKENLVIENSATNTFLGTSNKEQIPSPASICGQQGWPQRSMWDSGNMYSTEGTNDTGRGVAEGISRGQLPGITIPAREMHLGGWGNRCQAVPQSRFNNERQLVRNFTFPEENDQRKQSFNMKDRNHYQSIACDGQNRSCWMDSMSSIGAVTDSNPPINVCPSTRKHGYWGVHMQDPQEIGPEFVPVSGLTDTHSLPVSPIRGRSLSANRDITTHPNVRKYFQAPEFAPRRSRGQAIEAEEARVAGLYSEYPQHPHCLGMERPNYISPLTHTRQSECMSPGRWSDTATPEIKMGGYEGEDAGDELVGHGKCKDGGFERVTAEILKALEIAKRQVDVPMLQADGGGNVAVRYQSPSRFSVEAASKHMQP